MPVATEAIYTCLLLVTTSICLNFSIYLVFKYQYIVLFLLCKSVSNSFSVLFVCGHVDSCCNSRQVDFRVIALAVQSISSVIQVKHVYPHSLLNQLQLCIA